MNKIKSLILIGITSIVSQVSAQNVEVVNGKPFKLEKSGEYIENVLSTDKENFTFLVKRGKKNHKVVMLDENLGLKSIAKIELPEVKGKEVKFISAEKIGENTYFFSRSWDRKADTYTLYASVINTKTGKFDKHFEVLAAKDDQFNFASNPFRIYRSIDSSKILFTVFYPTKGKENAKYGFVATDNSLTQLWKNDIIFDELDKNFNLNQILIDKTGNIHMTATVRMSREEKRKAKSITRYYQAIYSYFPTEKDLKRYDVGFKDEIILSANFKLNDKDELVCTGFYGENKFFDAGMKGFFYFRIDTKTKSVVSKNLSPFDKKFLEQLMSKRKADKGKGLFNYEVRETFNMKDGGMTVVCEYYYHDYVYNQNNEATGEFWLYGDVLVFFLDKDGNMKTYSILKKRQYAYQRYNSYNYMFFGSGLILPSIYPSIHEVPYYGIGCMMKNDQLQLIYNENPKNAERAKAGKNLRSVRQRTSVTNLVQFDADGKITSTTLFKSKDKAAGYVMPIMPEYHYNYSNDAMIVIGKRGKNVRLVNIKVN